MLATQFIELYEYNFDTTIINCPKNTLIHLIISINHIEDKLYNSMVNYKSLTDTEMST